MLLYMYVLEYAILLGANDISSFTSIIKNKNSSKKQFFRRSLWKKIISCYFWLLENLRENAREETEKKI